MKTSIFHHTSFIIRLYLEYDHVTQRWTVRGQVEQPQTSQTSRFLSIDDLPWILSTMLDGQLGGFPVPSETP